MNMLKEVFLVVLAANLCNSRRDSNAVQGSHVVRLTYTVSRVIMNAFVAGRKNMIVYCDQNNERNVIQCVPLAEETQFAYDNAGDLGLSFAGQAIAYYYHNSEGCSYEAGKAKDNEVRAVMLLTDCSAITQNQIFIKAPASITAQIRNNVYDTCDWSAGRSITCSFKAGTHKLTNEAVWRMLKHPIPQFNRGLVHRCKKTYECTSCNSQRVCLPRERGTFYEYKALRCTSENPYCNYKTGTCQQNPDASCHTQLPRNIVSDKFVCMRDGMFPDSLSCSKYYTCDKYTAWVHYCPDRPTPYYHPELQICVASNEFCASTTSSPECRKTDNQGKKIPIFGTTNYFMSCGDGDTPEDALIPIDMCVGAYTFDTSDMSCRFRKCPHEGLFLYAGDCTKYIMCTPVPLPKGEYIITVKKCDAGKAFSEKEYQCVEPDRVSYCDIQSMDIDHRIPDTVKE